MTLAALAARIPWRWRHPIQAWRLGNWRLPGTCDCCGAFRLCHTDETQAYRSTGGHWLCHPCKVENDADTDEAWREYWSGRL